MHPALTARARDSTPPSFPSACAAPIPEEARQQAQAPAGRASCSSSSSSSGCSESHTASVTFIQSCRARRGAACGPSLKDAWQRKAHKQPQPQPQLQPQPPQPQPQHPQAHTSSCAPTSSTPPAADTEQAKQQQQDACDINELELALTDWLWDQEGDWPATEPDADMGCFTSCWMAEDVHTPQQTFEDLACTCMPQLLPPAQPTEQLAEACPPQLLPPVDSTGQLAEVLDQIFTDGPCAPDLPSLCSDLPSPSTLEHPRSMLLPPIPLPPLETQTSNQDSLPQDLNVPTPSLSCSQPTRTSNTSCDSTAQLPHCSNHTSDEVGGSALASGLQRCWSEQPNVLSVASSMMGWDEPAPDGLKRRWSEMPAEAAAAHVGKAPRVCLDLGPLQPAIAGQAAAAAAALPAPKAAAAAGAGPERRSLPPLMAALKRQQQQSAAAAAAAAALAAAAAAAAATAEPPLRRQPPAARAAPSTARPTAKPAAAGRSTPFSSAAASSSRAARPLGGGQAAALQALLEWQALSHRVVSAAAAPNQETAWRLLSDAELQRFLSRTTASRPAGAAAAATEPGGSGSSRQCMIDSIKRTVLSARAGRHSPSPDPASSSDPSQQRPV